MLTSTMTRRRLLQYGALAGGALVLPGYLMRGGPSALAAIPGGTLDPVTVPKYASTLFVPPAMPKTAVLPGGVDYYEIALRQFRQQLLPSGLPATTVWGYGPAAGTVGFSTPASTIEARVGRPVRVKWVNGLVDARRRFLPHLLPVDPTLHWANPPGGTAGRDSRPLFNKTPGPYTGPVPIVTHLHGAHVRQESDGYPEAWYLPAGTAPAGYASTGTFYDKFRLSSPLGGTWGAGNAVFEYPNDQAATALWFHDHTLGMTRANVYAGAAGFYMLRGGTLDLPPTLTPPEIPLLIQDRSFNADGSLFYPSSRVFFDGYGGPYIPGSDVPPIWNPEYFGNAMLVNGRTWPKAQVARKVYRLRLLNGCGSRFLVLKLVATAPNGPRPMPAALPFLRIGGDGGFLRKPTLQQQILLGPAERADVLVDFGKVPAGTSIHLINEGPDEPWGGPIGGTPDVDWPASDPETTGQVMRFDVGAGALSASASTTDLTSAVSAAAAPAPAAATKVRQVSLNELASTVTDGPAEAMLGTLNPDGTGNGLPWMDDPTETPRAGVPEVWEIFNFTEDAHPIHLHQTQFTVLNREAFGQPARPAEAYEAGPKDTLVTLPGEITRLSAGFDIKGRYVWHCHILEHEDNEMMRPMQVI